MIMPEQYLSENHPSEPLFEDDFVCVAWAGNTGLRERSISMRDYLRLGHVVVRFGEQQQVPAFEEKFMEHFSETRRIEVVTTGFTLVPQLVVGTTRIATVHRRLAQFYAKQLPLNILQAAGRDSPHGRIDAMARDSRRRSRPQVASLDFTLGLCRTPDRLCFSGRLLQALIDGLRRTSAWSMRRCSRRTRLS